MLEYLESITNVITLIAATVVIPLLGFAFKEWNSKRKMELEFQQLRIDVYEHLTEATEVQKSLIILIEGQSSIKEEITKIYHELENKADKEDVKEVREDMRELRRRIDDTNYRQR